MDWPQDTKDYVVFFTNELLQPTPIQDQGLAMTQNYYQALADDTSTPKAVRETAKKAAEAQANLIEARQQAVYALEEAAFTSSPPLGRQVVRRPKRSFKPNSKEN